MALENYQVLKGKPQALALDDDENPHIEVLIEAAGVKHRIAVNVRSQVQPHPLLFKKQDPFIHPLTEALKARPEGLTGIAGAASDLALDYVRGGFVERADMQIVPFKRQGPNNDLREFIEPLIRRAIDEQNIFLYAFGEAWGPEANSPDKYFHFSPGRGIHDIHMNQGSAGRFKGSNGPNQDGALLFHLAEDDRFIGLFLAFQSQSWDTDPATGHARTEIPDSRELPTEERLLGPVRLVAALVNPVNPEAGNESVTLLNRSDQAVDLTGWQILDRSDRGQLLAGLLEAGETRRIHLLDVPDGPRLRNKDGSIRLVDPDGNTADHVSYQKKDVQLESWTVVF